MSFYRNYLSLFMLLPLLYLNISSFAINRNNAKTYRGTTQLSINDIVINEIMFDPTPRVNLPDAEYIELFNNSDVDVLIEGWSLYVGKKKYSIPTNTLVSGGYVVLTKDISLFTDLNVVEVNISSLSNSGAELKIVDNIGNVINKVSYSSKLFTDDSKKDGGWSLELINPENNCLGSSNWDGSNGIDGGTPGMENSIFDLNFYPENTNSIVQVSTSDDVSSIAVLFTSFIDTSSVFIETNYLDKYDVTTDNNSDGSSVVTLNLSRNITSEINYFTFDNLLSCDGNPIATDTIWASGYSEISKGDIIINEVMFNPKDGSSEFVEIYNNSDNYLSLRNVYLSNFTTEDDESQKEGEKRISSENIVFSPKSYFVITKNAQSISGLYKSASRVNFIEIPSLPKLNNDEGNVAILDRAFNFVDKMVYSSEMHVGLISSEKQKGVSLERIKFNNSSLDYNNWTSASQASGGATPGLVNSVSPIEIDVDKMFEVYPEVFSPNNDGVNDVVELKYKLQTVGVVANVKVFNSEGVFIREIANNFLLGSSGSFIWNGMNENNSLCEKGIYVFWIEFFDSNGNVSVYKEICVLG